MNTVHDFMGREHELVCAPLLAHIAEQAPQADRTRSVDPDLIRALKQTDIMRLSATRNIGGVEASIGQIARELEAVSARCASTAWCLWNHLCVFHFIVAQMGPAAADLLRHIVDKREWVSFPAGAGTSVHGRRDGDRVIIDGRASFASGSRYGEWAACLFALDGGETQPKGKPDLRFTLVRTDAPGVSVDPTWNSMSLRASATDHINYESVSVPVSLLRPFPLDFRYTFRDPQTPVIAQRYREDWVAVSDLWLGAQAVGLANAALEEACAELAEPGRHLWRQSRRATGRAVEHRSGRRLDCRGPGGGRNRLCRDRRPHRSRHKPDRGRLSAPAELQHGRPAAV